MKALRLSCAPVVVAAFVLLSGGELLGQNKDRAQFKIPDNVELIRDVEYGKGGDRPLMLHILRAKEAPKEPMPVLVWVHGGGWQAGHRDSGISRLAAYAARGYFCATIEYRLSAEAIFPSQIEDCKCAIRFLRAKAKEFNLDPNRVGVWGSSAGGHLVSLLGTAGHVKELEGQGGWSDQSSGVQAVCDFCGPSDLVGIKSKAADGPVGKLLGGSAADKKALAELASPVTHVTKDAPPFLIVHGEMDTTVPISQAEVMHDALKKAGVAVTLQIAKGQGHGLGGSEIDTVVRAFFDKTLGRKD